MDNGTPKNKSALWQARQKLGVKRTSLRKRRAKAEEMEREVRLWEQQVASLEAQARQLGN